MRKTFWISICLLLFLLTGCGTIMGNNPGTDPAVTTYYVAPEAKGNGNASSPANAAYFRDSSLWASVKSSLNTSPVTVNFVPGEYVFSKNAKNGKTRERLTIQMGHPQHQLIVQGQNKQGTIFMTDPNEPFSESLRIDLLFFEGTNAVFRNLHFTGAQSIGYATKFYGTHVLIEDCTFIDMPNVYYGATGAHYARTSHITWKNNIFKRVGFDSHAHFIYNAYDPTYLYVINNYFEDCAGEYVRFRDDTDYVVAYGNTFKSTGTFKGVNRPFISVPLFNDDNPANPGPNPNYEYFGTHMLIANNTFIYPNDSTGGTGSSQRLVFRFYQSGWNPPGVQYFLTLVEGTTLASGSLAQKRALMQSHLGLDATQVYFYGNTYQGQGSTSRVEFQAVANYGEKYRGWIGPINIVSTLNSTPIVNSAEAASVFWQ